MRQLGMLADRLVSRFVPQATASACIKTGQPCSNLGSVTCAGCAPKNFCGCYTMPGGPAWYCSVNNCP
ncbi:hypothetical protein QEZ54_10625 [Catellatospora sp. KI3]|uniref:hypothetical protein n=1 Tax=Catellatospora sp. KI3 TaxID=3041620 RepID=UPI00248306B1|nr:hypothetical protein [Catellatospora sp. KI3]MDI1461424.1 hypothetical protein [Catellatospora sp. KI3]